MLLKFAFNLGLTKQIFFINQLLIPSTLSSMSLTFSRGSAWRCRRSRLLTLATPESQRREQGPDISSPCSPASLLLNVFVSPGCAKRKNTKDRREEKMLSLGIMPREICKIVTERPSFGKATHKMRTKQIPERYWSLFNAILQLPTKLGFQSLII